MDKSTVIEVLWLFALLIPGIVFLCLNNLRSKKGNIVRAIFAISIGWVFFFTYACSAQYLSAKSDAELNGAVFAFSATFGWVLPLFIVAITWLFSHLVMRYRYGSNYANKELA